MDIRYFFHQLGEFVDLSPELANADWEVYAQTADNQVHALAMEAFAEEAPSMDKLMTLLAFRDQILLCMLDGILYQQAVLDSDLSRPKSSQARMAHMAAHVKTLASKTESLPETYVLSTLPSVGTERSSLQQSLNRGSADFEGSELPGCLLTLVGQMQLMDKDLRRLKFGQQVVFRDPAGKRRTVGTDEIRKEITKVFDKCARLEHELQTSKAQRHTPWEQRLDQLNTKIMEKELQSSQLMNKAHKLDSELSNLKQQQNDVQRELQELNERNQKVTRENLPMLDTIRTQLQTTWTCIDRLRADAEMLASMFKLQVDEYRTAVRARDQASKELTEAQRALKNEKLKNTFKEDELQKKDTLYQRTVVARQDIHASYIAQKESIKEVEEKQRQQNEAWRQMEKAAEERNSKIAELRRQISEANKEIDLLEQQKKGYTQEFKNKVGRPCGMLLEQFKVVPKSDQK
eukprot:CAMPEP_0197697694 /NCGR_PEP_ID=MMETSP1338-20131121/118296_1 /TAXON_ID=43686 ORGANISM="Pelagodinium beii, Strain RCC1491" /NCGR_SAMPLE_ID=MMETSP1338 /ASSEMBLY_ACC=CAM_ASM_000754 /LENGTH=460 /DNA_ID=CAMNT_0043280967 /DNA_START=54 /DNA_END=1436 /DNA_ORIENTATION=+